MHIGRDLFTIIFGVFRFPAENKAEIGARTARLWKMYLYRNEVFGEGRPRPAGLLPRIRTEPTDTVCGRMCARGRVGCPIWRRSWSSLALPLATPSLHRLAPPPGSLLSRPLTIVLPPSLCLPPPSTSPRHIPPLPCLLRRSLGLCQSGNKDSARAHAFNPPGFIRVLSLSLPPSVLISPRLSPSHSSLFPFFSYAVCHACAADHFLFPSLFLCLPLASFLTLCVKVPILKWREEAFSLTFLITFHVRIDIKKG